MYLIPILRIPYGMLQTHSYRSTAPEQAPQWLPTTPIHPSPLHHPNPAISPRLTLVTLNIWFSGTHADVRYPSIFSTLLHLQADVICLQEVNDTFLRLLRDHPGMREKYGYFGGGGEGEKIWEETWYGCLILYRLDTVDLSDPGVYDCPGSNQGRHILHARVYGKNGQSTEGISDFRIGTAHIESPVSGSPNRAERERQLQTAYTLLSSPANGHSRGSLFCGDTNVSPEDELAFPSEMSWWGSADVWLKAGKDGGEPTFGITYPVEEPPKRLDRVFLFERPGQGYTVERAEHFGRERIESERYQGMNVFLSDHLGVVVTIRLDQAASNATAGGRESKRTCGCTVV